MRVTVRRGRLEKWILLKEARVVEVSDDREGIRIPCAAFRDSAAEEEAVADAPGVAGGNFRNFRDIIEPKRASENLPNNTRDGPISFIFSISAENIATAQ